MTIGDSHPPFGSYRLALMSLPTDQVTRACPDGFMASPNGEGQSVYESTRLAGVQPTPVSYRLARMYTFQLVSFATSSSHTTNAFPGSSTAPSPSDGNARKLARIPTSNG